MPACREYKPDLLVYLPHLADFYIRRCFFEYRVEGLQVKGSNLVWSVMDRSVKRQNGQWAAGAPK